MNKKVVKRIKGTGRVNMISIVIIIIIVTIMCSCWLIMIRTKQVAISIQIHDVLKDDLAHALGLDTAQGYISCCIVLLFSCEATFLNNHSFSISR